MSHSLYPPRVIAFEGVDGAGKTSVLGLVAEHLRSKGVEVCMPRFGKQTSKPIREIRQLTRDRTNLELCPRTELLLYAAREAQVLEQVVRPALARGATVLLDRSMLTPIVLGAHGRGLDLGACESIAREASGGQVPDLTLIFDVEPRTSRVRKRIEKIKAGKTRNAGRKGLAGSAMQERLREGYLSVAARDGLPVFHCERAAASDIAARVITKLETGAFWEDAEQSKPWWQVDPEASFEQAVVQLPSLLQLYFTRGLTLGRKLRAELLEQEPALAIWAADLEDPLLTRALEIAPDLVLARLWCSPGAVFLRERLLASHPADVARSLTQVAGDDADRMRVRLAELAPGAVVESLSGRTDPFAVTLRKRLWKHADVYERATSLQLCEDEWAWRRRERLLNEDPAVVLPSLQGLSPERVDPFLARHLERAPKSVLAALSGRTDTRAHQFRARLIGTGREVIDSIKGLDDARSWLLRECFCERWPSTVVSSLFGMLLGNRAKAVIARCREAAPTDLFTKRRLFLLHQPFEQTEDYMMTNYSYDSRARNSHLRWVPACFALVLATAACDEPSPPGSDPDVGGETSAEETGDAETMNTTMTDTGDGDGDGGHGDGDTGDGDGDTGGDGDGDTGDGDGDGDGDPVPPEDSLHPLVDDAEWTYVVTTTGGLVLGMKAMELQEIDWNGEQAWDLIEAPNNEGEWDSSVLMRIGDEVSRVHREEMLGQNTLAITDYDPGFVRISETWTEIGVMEEFLYDRTAYDGEGLNPDVEPRGHTFEVLAIDEEVTVPAGTFNCVKVERVRTVGTESGELVWYWYAPGVGKVREEDPDKMEVEELVSVSIPGGVELP